MADDSANHLVLLGVIFLAILLNAYLFGAVSQQFYSYWTSGFKDSKRVKAFVITQFTLVTLQGVMLWQLGWNIFVISYCRNANYDYKSSTWQAPVASVVQCVLILFANLFLAVRIHNLTASRLQAGLVMVFSISAFALAIATLVSSWVTSGLNFALFQHTTAQQAGSVAWHILQAISECLITCFLTLALLKSRTGFQKSDGVVRYLVGRVIQIGFFATLWTVGGLATWFLMPKYVIYAFFDLTLGTIYTHAIYDTLLSRRRLRQRLAEQSHLEMGLPIQSPPISRIFEGKSVIGVPNLSLGGNVSITTMAQGGFETLNASNSSAATGEENLDIECAPVGQAGVRYEVSYSLHA
ncbi:hypothetical protein BJV78DRAFT_1210104 [Lactifluus subvellereus]|nr:hypothetical protein BJV78DRAFT_1210104 [Lactifluus subvellereus]